MATMQQPSHSKKLSLIAATVLASIYVGQVGALGTCVTGTLLVDGCTLDGLTGTTDTVTGAVTLSAGTSYTGTIQGSSVGVGTVNFVSGTSTITGGLGTGAALATVAGAAATGTVTGALVATNVTVTTGTLTANTVSGNSTITTTTFGGAGTIALKGPTNALTTIEFANNAGTLTLAGSTSNTISANVANTGGAGASSGKGTLNLTGTGTHTVTGTAGLTGTYLAGINAGAGTTILTGAVFSNQLTMNGTKTVTFGNNSTVTTMAFGSNNGTIALASGKTLIGSMTTSGTAGAGVGKVTFSGTGAITGDLGNVSAGGTHLASIDASQGQVTVSGNLGSDVVMVGSNTLYMIGTGMTGSLAHSTLYSTANSSNAYGSIYNAGGITIADGNTAVVMNVQGFIGNRSRLLLASGGTPNNVAPIKSITALNVNNLVFVQDTSDTRNLTLIASRPSIKNDNHLSLLQAVSDPNAVLSNSFSQLLYGLDQGASSDAAKAYTQMAPQATVQASVDGAQIVQNSTHRVLMARLDALGALGTGMNAGEVSPIRSAFFEEAHLWIKGFGTFAHQKDRETQNGYKNNTLGAMLGLDGQYSKTTVGVAGAYASSNVKINDGVSETNINSYQGSIYGLRNLQNSFYLDGNATVAWNAYAGTRAIAFTGTNALAQSRYEGQQYGFDLGAGYRFAQNGWQINPRAGLLYRLVHLGAFTETNAGDLNLQVAKQHYNIVAADTGIQLTKPKGVRYGTLMPQFRIRYSRDLISDVQATNATLAGGGAPFVTTGLRPYRSTIAVGAGLGFFSKGRWSLVADYDIELKKDYSAQNVMMTGKMQF